MEMSSLEIRRQLKAAQENALSLPRQSRFEIEHLKMKSESGLNGRLKKLGLKIDLLKVRF